MHQVTIEQATANIASVFADVLRGEEIIITDRENPVAKVIPLKNGTKPERRFGGGREMIAYISDDFNEPLEDFKDYM
jgi:antitoxin (DNA-binding transcriptional repressor) of toxin-antitoxin stability system